MLLFRLVLTQHMKLRKRLHMPCRRIHAFIRDPLPQKAPLSQALAMVSIKNKVELFTLLHLCVYGSDSLVRSRLSNSFCLPDFHFINVYSPFGLFGGMTMTKERTFPTGRRPVGAIATDVVWDPRPLCCKRLRGEA